MPNGPPFAKRPLGLAKAAGLLTPAIFPLELMPQAKREGAAFQSTTNPVGDVTRQKPFGGPNFPLVPGS